MSFLVVFSQMYFNCYLDGNYMAVASRNNLYFYLQNTYISIENTNEGSTSTSLLKEHVLVRSEFPFTKVKYDYILGNRLR